MRLRPIRQLSTSVIKRLSETEFCRGNEMEYLPITSDGKKVYAGFWRRFCAALIDSCITIPFVLFFIWIKGFDTTLAIAISVPATMFFAMYHVYFNACFGGTPGKLAAGIRITKPDGSRIGWSEAWKRSSVDLVFAFLFLAIQIWALAHVDPVKYASLGRTEQLRLIREHSPAWFGITNILMHVWMWSELVVLLFNKRKRAIHDFIAGTVVIKKGFAEQNVASDADKIMGPGRTSSGRSIRRPL